MLRVRDLLDLNHTLAADLFASKVYPWEALQEIGAFILALGEALPEADYERRGEGVWVARDATVFASAWIEGPCIIGSGSQVRHNAFMRGNTLVGKGCVVGNATEMKNAILFDGAQVPHFNYVGDSVLGHRAHMGAGAITSNVKSDKTNVTVRFPGGEIPTGLRKFGAVLGDGVEVGCNAVLNPGTVVGRNSIIYPAVSVRGTVAADSIFKGPGVVEKRR